MNSILPVSHFKWLQCLSAIQRLDCLIVWGCLGSQSCGSAPRDTGQTHSICWKGMTGVQWVCVFEVYTHRHPHTVKWPLFERYVFGKHSHTFMNNECVCVTVYTMTLSHTHSVSALALCVFYTHLSTHSVLKTNTSTEGNLSWFWSSPLLSLKRKVKDFW